jgi:CubicO group peptidase (beta-lactamase class C family)
MYSTTGDLLKFIKALQNAELFDKSIFTEATTAKVDWVLPYPHRISYGYGFSVEKLWGVKFYGHSGSQPGVAARLRVYPELNMTVIILSNYDNATRNAMHYIFDLTADYQED